MISLVSCSFTETLKPAKGIKNERPTIPLATAITISKIECQCSSSSSIESQKPSSKIPRREDVSSDGMSVEKEDLKPSNEQIADVVMDSGTESSSTSKSPIERLSSSSPPTVKDSGGSAIPPVVASLKLDTLANLRWINQCSDEEKEKERIEQYKHDRRERYKKEMLLRKEQSGVAADRRRQYYSTLVK